MKMKVLAIWLGGLLLLGLAGTAQAVSVRCIGTESGGTGGPLVTRYCYAVNLAPGENMFAFDVGQHVQSCTCPNMYAVDANGLPIGWVGQCVAPGTELDFDGKTAHGAISPGPSGSCPAITLWQGPVLPGGAVYYFGHDCQLPSHDVGFTVTGAPGLKESWSAMVGMGYGPVHAPIPEPSCALLLILGICALRRRRRGA